MRCQCVAGLSDCETTADRWSRDQSLSAVLILQLVVKLSCLGQDVIYYYYSIVVSFDKSIIVLLYNGSLSVHMYSTWSWSIRE